MKQFSPVNAISWKGKILVVLIKSLLLMLSILKKNMWSTPITNFEEDPKYFKFNDTVYLAYKYYCKNIIKPDHNSGIKEYFHSQAFTPNTTQSDLTISLGGDLMPYQYINDKVCENLWDECGEFFFTSNIVFGNLETPIDLTKKISLVPEVMLSDMLFNGSEEIFSIFNGLRKYKGFDVLSVANNHSLDQGEEGLKQTLNFLKQKNILYCGAALTKKALHDFPIINKNGISTAFLAFTFSLNKFILPPENDWLCNHIRLNQEDVDISLIIEQAKLARQRGADIIIASLHMGNAYQVYPSKHIINTIHRICKAADIDVVVAGHPHNPQPIEWFHYIDQASIKKKSLIFYSLGDFVAYDIYSWAHLSLLIKLHITKTEIGAKVSGFEIFPAYMMPEFYKGKVCNLKFKHFEKVLSNTYHDNYIINDLATINQLYNEYLFTSIQRDQLMVSA